MYKQIRSQKQIRSHKKQIRSHKKQIRSQKQIRSHKKQIRSQKQIRSHKKQIWSQKPIRSYKKQTSTNYANKISDKQETIQAWDSTAWNLQEVQKHFSPLPHQSEI